MSESIGSLVESPPFGDRLILRARALGHPLCVGLDPHLDRIPPLFRRGSMERGDPATADVVEAFGRVIVERAAGKAVALKPQIAFFEQLGWRGVRALSRVIAHARAVDPDVLLVLDAKRGDIGSTAAGYAASYLTADAPLPVDALTVNPYLGLDTLVPLIDAARATGRGLFVLVKTSNPGSGDYQDREITQGAARLYEHVASTLAPIAASWRGPETGWSSLGVVVGATYPGESERVRALLPDSPFLVPGYGAQGGGAADAVSSFVTRVKHCVTQEGGTGTRGPREGCVKHKGGTCRREGGLVNSSRGILFPPGADTDDVKRIERAIDEAIARAADDLASAVEGTTFGG